MGATGGTTIPELRLLANRLTVGEETIDRDNVTNVGLAISSQGLRLTYFTARASRSSTGVRAINNGAAGATPSLVRFGLYSIAADGAGTLRASTVNDTAVFATGNTPYTKNWSVAYDLVAGQRYAYGLLVVTAAATPTFHGCVALSGYGAESGVAPRICGHLTGQADLPNSFADASLANSGQRFYAVIL